MINGQIQASEGFDVDWTKARCLYTYHPVEFDDDDFVDEPGAETNPETNLDLLNRLCEKSIGHYNQENASLINDQLLFASSLLFFFFFKSLFSNRIHHMNLTRLFMPIFTGLLGSCFS